MWIALLLVLAVAGLLTRALGLKAPLFESSDRVLLVVAHPDDEAMFFAPSILSLTCFRIPLSVLCLSTGGAYGLGKVREKELLASCKILQIPPSEITVIDHPQLQDGMNTEWPAEVVADEVHKAVLKFNPTKVLTFDMHGVSGHINHMHTHQGVLTYKQQQQTEGNTNSHSGRPLTFYMLESVMLLRKFSGLLDLPLSSLLSGRTSQSSLLVVSPNPTLGVRAMLEHKTQLAWYRMFFIMLSRYTMINTLREID